MEFNGNGSVSLTIGESSRCTLPPRSRASTIETDIGDRRRKRTIGAIQSGSICSVFSLMEEEGDVTKQSSNSNSCRICRDSTQDVEHDIISPCNCSGTLGRVHTRCLEEWLSASNKNTCEICKYQFQVERTPKNFIEWMKNPRSQTERRYIVGDCACFVVLTPLVITASWLCSQGAFYYFTYGYSWTAAGLMLLCTFLWFVFCFWMTITFRFHRKTWNEWRCMNQTVRLLIDRHTGMDQGGPPRIEETRNEETRIEEEIQETFV